MLQDLREAVLYVRADNPSAARATAARIRQGLERLPHFPVSSRVVPELAEAGYREIVGATRRSRPPLQAEIEIGPIRSLREVADKRVRGAQNRLDVWTWWRES
jgi:plasmid stabilization system protein ParE